MKEVVQHQKDACCFPLDIDFSISTILLRHNQADLGSYRAQWLCGRQWIDREYVKGTLERHDNAMVYAMFFCVACLHPKVGRGWSLPKPQNTSRNERWDITSLNTIHSDVKRTGAATTWKTCTVTATITMWLVHCHQHVLQRPSWSEQQDDSWYVYVSNAEWRNVQSRNFHMSLLWRSATLYEYALVQLQHVEVEWWLDQYEGNERTVWRKCRTTFTTTLLSTLWLWLTTFRSCGCVLTRDWVNVWFFRGFQLSSFLSLSCHTHSWAYVHSWTSARLKQCIISKHFGHFAVHILLADVLTRSVNTVPPIQQNFYVKWLRWKQRLRWKLWEQVCDEVQHHHKQQLERHAQQAAHNAQQVHQWRRWLRRLRVAHHALSLHIARTVPHLMMTPHTSWLKFWAISHSSMVIHMARSLWLDLSLLLLLVLLALLRLLPLSRAVLWAREPDRHGKSALLLCRREWGHLELLHFSHRFWAQPPDLQRAQRLISPLLLHDPFHGPGRGWRDTRRDAHRGSPRTSRLLRTRRRVSQSVVVCCVR